MLKNLNNTYVYNQLQITNYKQLQLQQQDWRFRPLPHLIAEYRLVLVSIFLKYKTLILV